MKLWFFRTPNVHSGGIYGLSKRPLKEHELKRIDADYWSSKHMPGISRFTGNRKPVGFPTIEPGSCVPVTLRAEG